MLGKFLPRLSYANVIATLALFLAVGGGAYAAVSLPKNSVGPRQLRSNAVTPNKSPLRPSRYSAGRRALQGYRARKALQGPLRARGPTAAERMRSTQPHMRPFST